LTEASGVLTDSVFIVPACLPLRLSSPVESPEVRLFAKPPCRELVPFYSPASDFASDPMAFS
jgi:hypothetical protein